MEQKGGSIQASEKEWCFHANQRNFILIEMGNNEFDEKFDASLSQRYFSAKYCFTYTSHMNFNWWSGKIRNVEYFSWTFWRTIERNENKYRSIMS